MLYFFIIVLIYMLLGVHCAKVSHILDDKTVAPSMSAAITRDVQACQAVTDIKCAQLFTIGPRSSSVGLVDYATCKAKNLFLIVHAAYILVGIWRVKPDNAHTQMSKKRLALLTDHLKTCVKLNSKMLVLHLPRDYTDEIFATMSIIAPIAAHYKVKLALEMTASKSHADRTYETPEKIDNLTKILNDQFKNKWCWALDTAHVWSTGSDIRGANAASFFSRLAYKSAIGLIHLNGSSVKLGAGGDKHEIAGGPRDNIFNAESLAAVIKFANVQKIPVICEVNRGTQSDFFKLLRKIKKQL